MGKHVNADSGNDEAEADVADADGAADIHGAARHSAESELPIEPQVVSPSDSPVEHASRGVDSELE